MAWIEPMLAAALDAAPRHLVIELKIYVTSVDSTSVSDGKETSSTGSPVISDAGIFDEKTFPALGGLSAMVRFNAGRPDVSALLREEIDATVGPVSVDGEHTRLLFRTCAHRLLVCGPESLANSVRSALRSEGGLGVLQGRAPVTLHVETFGM
jgi:ferric-chelate reductase